jgi:hypothetical protein
MDIRTFESEIERIKLPPRLWGLFTDFFHGTAVDRVIYHHIPPVGAPDGDSVKIRAAGVSEDMVKHYVDDLLFHDNPLFVHAQQSTEPFYFDEIAHPTNLDKRKQDFVDRVLEADLRRG